MLRDGPAFPPWRESWQEGAQQLASLRCEPGASASFVHGLPSLVNFADMLAGASRV